MNGERAREPWPLVGGREASDLLLITRLRALARGAPFERETTMADNKGGADKRTDNPQADRSVEELERESRHQRGAVRRDVADKDVGEDRLKEKGLEAPPLSDER
jgi:hypothetical protein